MFRKPLSERKILKRVIFNAKVFWAAQNQTPEGLDQNIQRPETINENILSLI
jgi:hypothetical protein